mmetsp:Transcript_65441/g.116664  ORF Transcript_65441/g.116664 Transcript_65441/m.116664 type:complete len:82 (-) Transcript_65441:958-1203(-)
MSCKHASNKRIEHELEKQNGQIQSTSNVLPHEGISHPLILDGMSCQVVGCRSKLGMQDVTFFPELLQPELTARTIVMLKNK